MRKKKLIKAYCEIEECTITDPDLLEVHHIIERYKDESTNNNDNLAILCSTHHTAIHRNKLFIYGIIAASKPPNRRKLVYALDGKLNVPLTEEELKIILPKYKKS